MAAAGSPCPVATAKGDRKSTRLNSSHVAISYAVFCLKKKTNAYIAARHLRKKSVIYYRNCICVSLTDLNTRPVTSPFSPVNWPILAALYVFFFNDTATTEIYTLSLHDALPI